MASGSGLGALLPVAMTVAGVVTMLRARARRKRGETPVDEGFERRQEATRESERRMAAYLDGRSLGPDAVIRDKGDEELKR
jgi:hypothetical protein